MPIPGSTTTPAATFVTEVTGTATRRWRVHGTDLGCPVRLADGSVAFFFGDTFSSPGRGPRGWRSPVMLRSTTTDLRGGIGFISAAGGRTAREILPNAHDVRELPDRDSPGSEFTVVPADAVTIGDRTYLSVVSVHSWGSADWPTNFTYLACTDDCGETWHRTDARWDNRGGSLDQLWTMERRDGYVYVISSTFDRDNPRGMILRRVPESHILDPAAYEDWGWDPATNWAWGQSATPILPGPVGEMCLRNIEGIWVLAYFDPAAYAIVTRIAERIDGPWSPPTVQVAGGDWGAADGTWAQIYGGYIHPASTVDDLHLLVSQWNTTTGDPYRVLQFRTRLDLR
ncbi:MULTISPECIES: DUF4185 domain-containing protein [unclassified Rhodococcus (in: high G+C Gram-positive bacteria)]|uniref:DUF4185 domain-containing protein n=1 Tax=unclassified Rhodococcus (in: high G+C Gram-positive bacteria) TaxID=192944 RepID=UPI00163A34DC|nr:MULTISPECIES: DUF4185 domain-containing protein [unclassified Rhodococcus (in: high G+C Gram-positive bacteria)]MBC2638459.1 DUF4185 domain-containing protein [Rhodococcus sp. 3A]MBC2896800.1 DUF4185 domain-containing protein [Rhodococcus sp. 4CII]